MLQTLSWCPTHYGSYSPATPLPSLPPSAYSQQHLIMLQTLSWCPTHYGSYSPATPLPSLPPSAYSQQHLIMLQTLSWCPTHYGSYSPPLARHQLGQMEQFLLLFTTPLRLHKKKEVNSHTVRKVGKMLTNYVRNSNLQ